MFILGWTIGAVPLSLLQVYGLNTISYFVSLLALFLSVSHRYSQVWQSLAMWFIGVGVGTLALTIWDIEPLNGAGARLIGAYIICTAILSISLLPEAQREAFTRDESDVYEAIRNSLCRPVVLAVPILIIAVLLGAILRSADMSWILAFLLFNVVLGLRATANRWARLAAVWTPAFTILFLFLLVDFASVKILELALSGVVVMLGTIWAIWPPRFAKSNSLDDL